MAARSPVAVRSAGTSAGTASRAAASDGLELHDRLLERLENVPGKGPTPHATADVLAQGATCVGWITICPSRRSTT